MAAVDDAERMLRTLKEVYRAAGLRYADVASALDVSELTIKRWLTGKGLTLAALTRLCSVADISLMELAEAARAGRELPIISSDQAEAIAADIVLGLVLFLLSSGWNAARIARELSLDGTVMNGKLARLDRLGVITLFPGNRVRVLRQINRRIRDLLPTFALVARRAKQFLDGIDLLDPAVTWTSGLTRLSAGSFTRVQERLDQTRDELFELGKQDLELDRDDVTWYTVFAALRPIPIETLLSDQSDGDDH